MHTLKKEKGDGWSEVGTIVYNVMIMNHPTERQCILVYYSQSFRVPETLKSRIGTLWTREKRVIRNGQLSLGLEASRHSELFLLLLVALTLSLSSKWGSCLESGGLEPLYYMEQMGEKRLRFYSKCSIC
jgi:hypothetical protein